MNEELKIIKKKYGEKMAHFCRDYFATILETDGLLLKLMLEHFEPSHDLYEDIINQKKEIDFKNYIYSLVDVEKNKEIKGINTPMELLSEVGYDLYECTSEEDIQKFKKYYAKGEELCTFDGGRLDRCYVFFAVKKNVFDIKREDYPNPQRQDEYGTSVISIQFTRDDTHTLSIKNRYNHTVNNPDSTYSNNLDNIVEGLTVSFAEHYGLVQQHPNNRLELESYVKASDGKYYKYNQEFFNVYYCPHNIVIDHYEVKRYDKEKYIVFDYFILDLVNKEIRLYDRIKDAFPDTILNIQKIEIKRKEEEKEIIITLKDNKVTIVIDKDNRMIKLDYPKIKQVGDGFLGNAEFLKEINLPNIEIIDNEFLYHNDCLRKINMPRLRIIGDRFLNLNFSLEELSLPSLEETGISFLVCNRKLRKLNFPNLKKVGDSFLASNTHLMEISLPSLEETGNNFLEDNVFLKKLSLPLLKKVENNFLLRNRFLEEVNLPSLEEVGDNFLKYHPTFIREDFITKFKR